MGANAVTTVPVYTAGEVLTAADLNITNSGIPVFASTVERDAAFDGTGEKTLAEGQYAYLESTKATQFYDGAAWQPVGASGLTLISATTLSGTTSINDCFSASYQNYIIKINALPDGSILRMRYRVAGADNSTSNYDSGSTTSYTDANTAPFVQNSSAATSFNMALPTACELWNGSLEVFNPFATDYSSITARCSYSQSTYPIFHISSGFNFRLTTSFTGVTFFTDSGVLTGTVKVYGLANS